MRSLAVVASLVLLIVLASLWWSSSRSTAPRDRTPAAEAAPDRAPEVSPRVEPLDASPAPLAAVEKPAEERVEATKVEAPKIASSAACIVRGRIVDQADRPLAGVEVTLAAYKAWAEGVEVPRLPGKLERSGWTQPSASDGAFRFEAPALPTSLAVFLLVEPQPYLDSERIDFGGRSANARAPLLLGDNDVGTLRLAATGAIRGRVVDEAGRPIAGASLTLADKPWTTLGRAGESDASGSFLVAHVKPGTFGLNAKHDGFLSEFRTPIEIAVGRTTEPVDFVLHVAPTLSGAVVDENGAGLAGAKLQGWPTSGGSGAHGVSRDDGTFTVNLPQNEPYTLQVDLAGYETFGLDDRSTRYAPNTNDLRIVLKRSANATTRFVVVDAETGAPIESFGIEIERDRGTKSARNSVTDYEAYPKPQAHPGGEVELDARPGFDRFTVAAPGRARERGDVVHESPTSARQVVKLQRSARVFGRTLVDGKPREGVDVLLDPGTSFEARGSSKGADGPKRLVFRSNGGPRRATRSGAGGRFELVDVDPGGYRVLATAPTGESLEILNTRVPKRAERDLGNLELSRGGSIAGRVLVPLGRSAQGLVVWLDGERSGIKATSDVAGAFRFENVREGVHEVELQAVQGSIAGGASATVKIAPAETVEVELDARSFGVCRLTLHVERNGAPAALVSVLLLDEGDRISSVAVGKTDHHGVLIAQPRAVGPVRVQLGFNGPIHPDLVIDLALDRDVEARASFETGSAAVVWQQAIDGAYIAEVSIERSGSARAEARHFFASSASLSNGVGATLDVDARTLTCPDLTPGSYTGTLELTRTQNGGGALVVRNDAQTLLRRELAFVVVARETTTVR